MGLARLGALVNFISHTVVVGFTAGAGLLIIAAQLGNFTGVPVPSGAGFFESLRTFVRYAASADPWIFATGALTLVAAIAAKRWLPRIPYMIVGMVAGSLFGYALASTGMASGADRRRTAVGVACIVAAVIRSRRMAQARAGGARADGARSRPGSIGRARRRREIGAADRQQPGIHRPGPVQHRPGRSRRPIRRRARSTGSGSTTMPGRAHRSPRSSRPSSSSSSSLAIAPLVALPPAGHDGGAAVRRRVGPDRGHGDAQDRRHTAAARRWFSG